MSGGRPEGDPSDDGVVTTGQLRVPVAELRRELGSRMEIRRRASLDGLGVVDAQVPDDGVVDVELVLDAVSDGLVASGRVTAPWIGRCRRCLDEVRGESVQHVQEAFTPAGEGDTYVLDGDEVDLEPLVRDAVALGLPLAPLCGDDCRGPDPGRFPARPADEAGPGGDPRWAALDALSFDDEGE